MLPARVLAAVVALCAAGCLRAHPADGALRCDAAGRCPSGYRCADDGTCWSDGRAPDLGTPFDLSTPSDAATGDLLPAACVPGALLCEDFEHGFGAWSAPMSPGGSADTVEIDGLHVHAGAGAAHVTVAAGTQPAIVRERNFPIVVMGTLALRAWVYYASTPTTNSGFLDVTFADSLGGDGFDVGNIYDSDGGTQNWYALFENPYTLFVGSAAVTGGAWHCVELDFDLGAHHGTLSVDGATLATVDKPNMPPLGFAHVFLGATTGTAGGSDFFIDDLAIASQRIGDCP